MIRNIFIVALRNFLRQRTSSILNVSGLAIGLACSIFVFLYAFDELTFDTQHPDPDNTYRIVWKSKSSNGEEQITPWALVGWAHYMKQNLKGVKGYSSLSRYIWPHSFYFTQPNGGQRVVLSEDVTYAMKNYCDFFYLELVEGDKKTFFDQSESILISETAAKELFGNENVLDKALEFSHPFLANQKITVIVKGIFRDLPYNMQYGRSTKYIINRAVQKSNFERWPPNGTFENALTSMWHPSVVGSIYFQTEPHADLDLLRQKLEIEINKAASVKQKEPSTIKVQFIKITDTHFSSIPNLIQPEMVGQKQYLYIFLTIGAFILLISCINYTNLATARSMQRAKEVGMRKAMGSHKKQLVFQFLQESFFITGVSLLLGVVLAVLLLPYFSDFSNKDFIVGDIFRLPAVSMMIFLWVIVSVLSGMYPAFYMASLETIKILKGGSNPAKGGKTLRHSLMLFQFTISVVLVGFTLVVIRQMNEMINNDLNKEGDQILSIRYGNFAPVNKLNVLRDELARHPDLGTSSFGNHLPQREGFTELSYEVDVPENDEKYTWDMMSIGADFPTVLGLELIAGKLFDPTAPMDSSEVLVNEEVARQLLTDPQSLPGRNITVKVRLKYEQRDYNFKIRGVVRDFKLRSAHEKITPVILSLVPRPSQDIIYYIKLPAGNLRENVAKVQEVWKNVMPANIGMSYWFLSDEFNRLYFEENALHRLSKVFTVLGLITTCIGIFGMSVFLTERRRKEMAIRKVMGAHPSDVIRKMVAPFLYLMAIACVAGLPIAYYFSNTWLDSFVHKVRFDWTVVVLSVLTMLVITLITVAYQSFKSANANPVHALKD